MLIDTMFARDMYQVFEVNDDWLITLLSFSIIQFLILIKKY